MATRSDNYFAASCAQHSGKSIAEAAGRARYNTNFAVKSIKGFNIGNFAHITRDTRQTYEFSHGVFDLPVLGS